MTRKGLICRKTKQPTNQLSSYAFTSNFRQMYHSDDMAMCEMYIECP